MLKLDISCVINDFKLSVMTASPKEVVRKVPYEDVTGIETSEKKATQQIAIALQTGGVIGLESARLGPSKHNKEVFDTLRQRAGS